MCWFAAYFLCFKSAAMGGGGDLIVFRLPEECVANVLSFTSPRDTCKFSLVSSIFRSAAMSDAVWERFLPSDLIEILSQAFNPPVERFSSKKDLFFFLCQPILIDGGQMCFMLERSTGRKCYALSPQKLAIIKGSSREASLVEWPESRFEEAAVLFADWFTIYGKIEANILSKKTNYAAYLVFSQSPESLHRTSVSLRGEMSERLIRLSHNGDAGNGVVVAEDGGGEAEVVGTRRREDLWMEVEMGEFFTGDGEEAGEVEIRSRPAGFGPDVAGWLVVEGIEIRPKM